MPISLRWSETDDTCRCAIAGELDLSTEPRVRRALFDGLAERPSMLVIDLAGVSFIDSMGLRALLACRHRADETGTRVVLSGVGHAIARTLEITNLLSFFEIDARSN